MDYVFEEKVWILGTTSPLDGLIEKIVGIASLGVIDFYIVYFDKPLYNSHLEMSNFQAIVLPESCLEPV